MINPISQYDSGEINDTRAAKAETEQPVLDIPEKYSEDISEISVRESQCERKEFEPASIPDIIKEKIRNRFRSKTGPQNLPLTG